MKEISHRLRLAYLTLLEPLIVEGVTIPIFDGRVPSGANIPVYRDSDAYILITDQNEVETTENRCNLKKLATISLDIVTKYPLNQGGSLASELISDAIQQAVRVNLQNPIAFPEFQVISTRLEFSRNFVENGQTETAYRKVLAFSHNIYEL